MSAPPPKADFKLVLMSVNPAQAQNIAAELADVFPIDRKVALSAVQATPIVLVSGMTQQMAVNLRSHLVRLGRLGAQLRLTADPVGKLKQLRWPSPPPATLRPANIFMCPACGERFVVHRWQPAVQAPPQPVAASAPAAAPATVAPPAAPPSPEETPLPEAEPVQLTTAEEEAIPEAEPVEAELPEAEAVPEALPAAEPTQAEKDELAEITGFLDSILKEKGKEPEAAPPLPAPAAPAAPATPPQPAPKPEPIRVAPPPQAIPISSATHEPKTQPRPASQPVPMRLAPAAGPPAQAAAPKPAQPAAQPPAPQPAQAAPPRPKPMEIKPPSQAPSKPPAAAPPGPQPRTLVPPRPVAPPKAAALTEPAGPRYDVSVARVRGAQQDELVRLLVQRLAMTPEDAQKQAERTVVMVCKGGTAAEAEEWRKALESAGIKSRIRKH